MQRQNLRNKEENDISSRGLHHRTHTAENILETAGYNVKTAVDGADALALVKSEVFDVVVTDVDMPRMNGFETDFKDKG